MSDTPTYASLLTRLFSGSPEERAAVLAHLESDPADRAAAEPEVRARLRDSFPWLRLIAAEAVLRVYRDAPAAVEALAYVIRASEPGVVADAAGVVRKLDADAVPLLVLMARHAPDVFAAQTTDFQRWAGNTSVRSGPDGLVAWLAMLEVGPDEAATALLIGMAYAASVVDYDLAPAQPALRAKLAGPSPHVRAAAGAALWRATWRVNRDWFAPLDPRAAGMEFPGLRDLLVDVLVEHLGRRPEVADRIRGLLAALATDSPITAARAVGRLARLGSRGWGVLVPMLRTPKEGDTHAVPLGVREAIFRQAADRPAVLPLVHHHAHAVIATAAAEGSTNDLVPHAAKVLSRLGPAAGMAVPDLLNLVARVPHTGSLVGSTLSKVAAGFPNTPAAIVRALGRVRGAAYFGAEHLSAFEALAWALVKLDPDAGPALVANTGIDPRVPESLLQHPGWKDAPPSVRDRHVRMLADALASPRPEVRIRAADLLRHYRDELPAVWPSPVAVLACADEKAAVAVLPLFRHLGPVADAVSAELCVLFGEKNPAYASRAVVALWRLGRMSAVESELRAAVESTPNDRGWAVLCGVVDRAGRAHGLLGELNALFADAPAAVAERVTGLLNPPEESADAEITRLVPRPGDPTAPVAVDWVGVRNAVEDAGAAGALFAVALMCEYGSVGSTPQKIWMIKNHRELTRIGLAESKRAVEQVMGTLERAGAPAGHRQQAVREYFTDRTELPPEIVGMLEHRLGWFRWAGLELADAWGLGPERARQLTEDRVWDTNPRVRERALRMARG